MKKSIILFFICCSVWAQDTIVFPKIDAFKRNILEVSYGKPLGNLANKYESSITTAFYMRTKIAKRQFVDFGVELSGIVKGNSIDYNAETENIRLDGSKSALFLGFRYTRFLFQSKNENFHIESNSGIGWKYLHYSKPEDEIYDELDIKPTLNTIAVSQGIKIVLYGFGLHCNYQYSPYTLFNSKVERNFGASSINFGISGSWNF
ncbi:hypothetical protein FBBAL38_07860 [Flavobacteria bacterium BAL38]|uniref:hypothetical protein n=1 Tax=unclassified Flavobacterium TaxID=196869 RepID=UPI0000F3A15B|nr:MULTISPECIES: hypothetical protein [unclassified Flavobacterium]EAZ95600.1 hypothetical protein FBBAL38_07860 [Flavobacteria bacterium BAL38]MQP51878.1 hypothetical protein [Flavobacterium sp. LMO9]MQP61747.1 hypothetical protein [Flavobacterium sp. LMO6]